MTPGTETQASEGQDGWRPQDERLFVPYSLQGDTLETSEGAMIQRVHVIHLPVSQFARWFGAGGVLLGIVVGVLTILANLAFGTNLSSAAFPRAAVYGAPLYLAVGWGAFGLLIGALSAATYNHLSQLLGGLGVECEISDPIGADGQPGGTALAVGVN